ncbi:hypothetical protein QQF64_002902 [Cirrhinus molitorella]|uniref:Uncharacterized protein n=1 Tax=Cirrhinus molitorella TaxID=172907 RepID=A0ABR3MRG0_9TELE
MALIGHTWGSVHTSRVRQTHSDSTRSASFCFHNNLERELNVIFIEPLEDSHLYNFFKFVRSPSVPCRLLLERHYNYQQMKVSFSCRGFPASDCRSVEY